MTGWWFKPTPLKNMSSSIWLDDIPYIMEKSQVMFFQPPISIISHIFSLWKIRKLCTSSPCPKPQLSSEPQWTEARRSAVPGSATGPFGCSGSVGLMIPKINHQPYIYITIISKYVYYTYSTYIYVYYDHILFMYMIIYYFDILQRLVTRH